MSRIRELREKFRQKALAARPSERFSRFTELVNACVAPKGAGNLHASHPWIAALYKQTEGVRDEDLDVWIAERVAGLFESSTVPPRWVYEPTWSFENDVPLTFVGQMADAEDGTEIYLFAGTRQIGANEIGYPGWRRFYKMIVQEGSSASDHCGLPGEIHTTGVISL